VHLDIGYSIFTHSRATALRGFCLLIFIKIPTSCKTVYTFMIPESFRDGKALPATHYKPAFIQKALKVKCTVMCFIIKSRCFAEVFQYVCIIFMQHLEILSDYRQKNPLRYYILYYLTLIIFMPEVL
jgi:hypothetical protein